jgi:hypothetical protein
MVVEEVVATLNLVKKSSEVVALAAPNPGRSNFPITEVVLVKNPLMARMVALTKVVSKAAHLPKNPRKKPLSLSLPQMTISMSAFKVSGTTRHCKS